jgi:hypothetical protein
MRHCAALKKRNRVCYTGSGDGEAAPKSGGFDGWGFGTGSLVKMLPNRNKI